MNYRPFSISIAPEGKGNIRVTAQFMGVTRYHSQPGNELPFSREELDRSVAWLDRGHIDTAYARDLGERLFQLLFRGDVLHLLLEAEARLADDEGLRLLLQLPADAAADDSLARDLINLPWELMSDARYGFLARSRKVSLVFHDPGANLPNRLADGKMPLRVLLIASAPEETDPIQSAQEIEAVTRALMAKNRLPQRLWLAGQYLAHGGSLWNLRSYLRNLRRFEIVSLHEATRSSIRQCLDRARGEGEPFHVVHYIGHGEFSGGTSYLLLNAEDDSRGMERLTGEEFVDLIADPHINLLVINACQTATINAMMASVAERAMLRGVPVVIGMRMNVFDEAAVSFARDFYTSLAAGEPVEGAMATARLLTRRAAPGETVDWSIPRMFMGWSDGLALPKMALRSPTFLQRAWKVLAALLAFLGALSMLIGLPSVGRTAALEVPGIKCLELYPMDENKFTVAFYPFGVLKADGGYVRSADGTDLAQFLFNRFEQNFADLDIDIPYELRSPSHACAIKGKDSAERAEQAAEIAEQIDADVIIYGTIMNADIDPRLSLEFHVSYSGFTDGDEIAGPHALGSQIPVELPFDPESLLVISHPIHLVWTDILSKITIGLSYYSVDDFQSALAFLNQAEQVPQWPNSDGKEIIHLLLGNAYLRQASRDRNVEGYRKAREHYLRAQEIAPEYVRARVGEANTDYLLALGDPNNPRADQFDDEMLDDAESKYLGALTEAEQAGDQTSVSRIRFGLGQIYLARALKHDSHSLATSRSLQKADDQFESVIRAFINGNDRLSYQASHAYYYLALVHRLYNDEERALHDYQAAVKHASPYYRAEYGYQLAKIYCSLNQTSEAIKALRNATDTARVYGYAALVDRYVADMDVFESEGCEKSGAASANQQNIDR